MRRWCLLLATTLVVLGVSAFAAPPKPAKKETPPRFTVAWPLGVVPAKTTRLTLRGFKLDTATTVRVHDPKGSARLLGKRKVGARPQDVGRIGDTEADVEVILSAGYPGRTVTVAPVSDAGEGPGQPLLVERVPVVAEKEPNDGFRQAQRVVLPQEIQGQINRDQDVDLYRFEGRAGQKIILEIHAARYGSALDSILTLYDAGGGILASNDDIPGSTDSRIAHTLPKTGTYYVGVVDANDSGGAGYVYRLSLRVR